jgi:hypothetical protein
MVTPVVGSGGEVYQKSKKAKQSRQGDAWGERRYGSYAFLTSAVDGGEWSASRPVRALPRGRDPGAQCTRGWVGLRASMDTEVRGKIPCPWQGSNPDRPVVQPVARHYTDWATRLLKNHIAILNFHFGHWNTVMCVRILFKGRNFCAAWVTVRFPRRVLVHEVDVVLWCSVFCGNEVCHLRMNSALYCASFKITEYQKGNCRKVT